MRFSFCCSLCGGFRRFRHSQTRSQVKQRHEGQEASRNRSHIVSAGWCGARGRNEDTAQEEAKNKCRPSSTSRASSPSSFSSFAPRPLLGRSVLVFTTVAGCVLRRRNRCCRMLGLSAVVAYQTLAFILYLTPLTSFVLCNTLISLIHSRRSLIHYGRRTSVDSRADPVSMASCGN